MTSVNNSLVSLNEQIKNEADQILNEKGLHNILQKYGKAHITGSYDLDLMTWRDLDIYLEVSQFSEKDFFLLGSDIATALRPVKMSFRNELIAKTNGLPLGLYWGVYLGNERAGAWKIDIWCVDAEECKRLLNFCVSLKEKITPEAAIDIMKIKSQCWQDPRYRRDYTSSDIYKAVLEKNIRNIEDFRKSLLRTPSEL
jgi:hypothetical protein